ncbi:MAG: SLOG family protein [Firmicutes bacterium]|nr:SLOG family protein [Bacillota bacterium]
MEHTCAFTGHRYLCRIPKTKYQYLLNAVKHNIYELYISCGVRTFLTGMALGADMLCAQAVLDMRRSYPDIKLVCVLPCLNQTQLWNDADRAKYRRIINCASKVICLSDSYYDGCMQARNKYMVSHADMLLAVYDGRCGGTQNTYRCAKRSRKAIIRINPKDYSTDWSDFSGVLFRY